MKLTSMTDFVLEQEKNPMQTYQDAYRKIREYAKFLKQPLTLEMFVPCDENGNIPKEPKKDDYYIGGNFVEYNMVNFNKDKEIYKKAKEKVLFEGFEVKGNYIMYYDFAYMMKYELEGKTVENIIDEIPNNSLQLTQNAIKQIE